MVCAQRCDIALDVLIEVLTSGGGDSTALKRITPYLQDKDSSSFRFSLANSRKDLGYYHAFAEHIDTARDLAGAAAATLNNIVSVDNQARPLPELVDLLGTGTVNKQ